MFRKFALCAVIALVAVVCVSDTAAQYLTDLIGPGVALGMAFNATALNAYVKRTYDPKFVEASMTSRMDKTLKDIKRMTDGSGENFSWLVDADDSFNGSADFAIAQAAAAANNN